jgi:hypothetical protein
LIGARQNPRPLNRLGAGFALALAFVGASAPIACYFASFHDYPWLVVVPLALCGTVGAHVCGLRVITCACIAFLMVWLFPAVLPPATGVGAVCRVNDLECTLLPRDPSNRAFQRFQLRDLAGRDLEAVVAVDDLSIRSEIGPLIRVGDTIPIRLPDDAGKIRTGATATFFYLSSAPSWTRTIDLNIAVPRLAIQGVVSSATVFRFNRVSAH